MSNGRDFLNHQIEQADAAGCDGSNSQYQLASDALNSLTENCKILDRADPEDEITRLSAECHGAVCDFLRHCPDGMENDEIEETGILEITRTVEHNPDDPTFALEGSGVEVIRNLFDRHGDTFSELNPPNGEILRYARALYRE